MPFEMLTVVGAGLIGGSVALAARERGLARRVVALDSGSCASCPSASVFDEWLPVHDAAARARAYDGAGLIVLATPVRAIVDHLPEALASGALVTDCGSTKRAIVQAARSCPGAERFVAGHPMAGHPEGGLKNASAELFVGHRWILCPESGDEDARREIEGFVGGLGAEVLVLDAAAHDRFVAVTSHLPQVVASALAVLAEQEHAARVAGPGFASATRVAGGAEAMWRDIFTTNGPEIGRALRLLGQRLVETGEKLNAGDPSQVLELLEEARALRARRD